MKTELFNDRLEDVTQFLTRLEETLAARTDLTEERGGMVWIHISEARQILDVIGFVQTLPKYLGLAGGEYLASQRKKPGDCCSAEVEATLQNWQSHRNTEP